MKRTKNTGNSDSGLKVTKVTYPDRQVTRAMVDCWADKVKAQLASSDWPSNRTDVFLGIGGTCYGAEEAECSERLLKPLDFCRMLTHRRNIVLAEQAERPKVQYNSGEECARDIGEWKGGRD